MDDLAEEFELQVVGAFSEAAENTELVPVAELKVPGAKGESEPLIVDNSIPSEDQGTKQEDPLSTKWKISLTIFNIVVLGVCIFVIVYYWDREHLAALAALIVLSVVFVASLVLCPPTDVMNPVFDNLDELEEKVKNAISRKFTTVKAIRKGRLSNTFTL